MIANTLNFLGIDTNHRFIHALKIIDLGYQRNITCNKSVLNILSKSPGIGNVEKGPLTVGEILKLSRNKKNGKGPMTAGNKILNQRKSFGSFHLLNFAKQGIEDNNANSKQYPE